MIRVTIAILLALSVIAFNYLEWTVWKEQMLNFGHQHGMFAVMVPNIILLLAASAFLWHSGTRLKRLHSDAMLRRL